MYIINPMLHYEKKLFHVSVHIAGQKSNIGWKAQSSKARYIYNNLINGIRSNNERGLTAGLAIAFINTDYIGWVDVPLSKQYATKEDAAREKAIAIAKYEKLGYANVGVRNTISNNNGSGTGGVQWTKKFSPSMKQDKIYAKIDWINTSLQLEIPISVKNMAYGILAGANSYKRDAKTLYGFTLDIDNLATLLVFVRRAMGLR